MNNPFEHIANQLSQMAAKIDALPSVAPHLQPDIINQDELCARLRITKATAIEYAKKGKIPVIRIGAAVRYNWPSVVAKLEAQGGGKYGR